MNTINWNDLIVQDYSPTTLDQLPDTFFWAGFLKHELAVTDVNLWLEINCAPGFLFVGAPGNGRHTLAEAAAATLNKREKRKYRLIRLDGFDLEADSPEEFLEGIDSLFRFAASDNRIVILLENITECPYSDHLQRFLARKLQNAAAGTASNWLLFIIADEQEELHHQLLRNLQTFRCSPPDEWERRMWLKKTRTARKMTFHISVHNLKEKEFADATQGFSWQAMRELERYLRILLKEKILAAVPLIEQETAEVRQRKRADVLKNGEVFIEREALLDVCSRMHKPEKDNPVVFLNSPGILQPPVSAATPTTAVPAPSAETGGGDVIDDLELLKFADSLESSYTSQ